MILVFPRKRKNVGFVVFVCLFACFQTFLGPEMEIPYLYNQALTLDNTHA